MENINDVRISGLAKVNGGKYRNIDISGMGEISGDVEAESIEISGLGTVKGNAVIRKVRTSGSGTFEGNLECDKIKISGVLKVTGKMTAGDISNKGSLTILENLKAQRISTNGLFTCEGGVEAESFDIKGGFKVQELLNSEKIDIKLVGHCYAREIGGEDIFVARANHLNFSTLLGLFGYRVILETNQIEGNTISLEYTEAKIVRGSRVKIGPKCIIENVEYSDTLDIHPEAIVKNQTKI